MLVYHSQALFGQNFKAEVNDGGLSESDVPHKLDLLHLRQEASPQVDVRVCATKDRHYFVHMLIEVPRLPLFSFLLAA